MRKKKSILKFFFYNKVSTSITIIGCLLVVLILSLEFSSLRRPQTNVPSKIVWAAFDGGSNQSGVNSAETRIAASTVTSLNFLWQKQLPYTTNGTPVEVPNVQTAAGTKDLIFVTTQKGSLVALDAATGSKVWQADTTGNFVGGQGTSSSPAIDPSGQFIYSYGLDGKVHKYAVATGVEDTTKGFPVTVTLSTDVEKISAPLNVGNGFLYTITSGYDGDFGQYVGHVVAVNVSTGTTTVWNSLCSNVKQLSPAGFCPQKGSGMWGRAAAAIDPDTKNVFVVTGNGNYNANSGGTNYGDSVIELTPDLSKIVDTFTPTSFSNLDSQDDDLGSTGVGFLPQQSNTSTPFLVVVGGKDNKVRLLNKQNLSGQGGPNHMGGELQTLPVSCQTLAHPVVWNDTTNTTWIFMADTCGNLYAYKAVNSNSNNKTTLQQVYEKNNLAKNSPFMANGILFTSISNNLSAIDPTTGNVLWSSKQASANIGSLHWQSPLVVNGAVYMPDDNGNITAYALTNVTPGSNNSISLNLSVFLHGIGQGGDNSNPNGGGTSNPAHTSRSVTITLLNSTNNPITTGNGTLAFNTSAGNFQGTVSLNAVNGSYLAAIKVPGYLPKQFPGIIQITGNNTLILQPMYLTTGDINNDNQLDILDYNLIVSCFGSKQNTSSCTTGPTQQSQGADLNDDGSVNGADYNLFLRELSVQKGG